MIITFVTIVAHYLNGGIRLPQSSLERVTPAVKTHVSVLLALLALVKAAGNVPTDGLPALNGYSKATANALRASTFDRKALGARGLAYERLDQLTVEVILGVR